MNRVLMFPALAVFVHTCDVQLNVEIVALNLFTIHFNHVADTEMDFPFVTAAAKTSVA